MHRYNVEDIEHGHYLDINIYKLVIKYKISN